MALVRKLIPWCWNPLLLLRTVLWLVCVAHSVEGIGEAHSTLPRNHNAPVSFIYLVGIEGVGHHGVTPALSVIARSCGYHVEYEPAILRRAQNWALTQTVIAYLSHIWTWSVQKHGTNKVVVIEDQSFPTDGICRNCSLAQKKRTIKYNLEWLYNQAQSANADVRFFHLTRDFYRTVASHPEFDNGFQQHALVLKGFLEYISLEKRLIDSKKPDLWRQIHYEWFTDMQNCTALVSAVIDFAGWNDCDVEFACEVLQKILRKGSNRTVDEADYAFAQSLNASIPVPDLDISADREYAFDRVVSTRDWNRFENELRSAKGLRYNMPARKAPEKPRAKRVDSGVTFVAVSTPTGRREAINRVGTSPVQAVHALATRRREPSRSHDSRGGVAPSTVPSRTIPPPPTAAELIRQVARHGEPARSPVHSWPSSAATEAPNARAGPGHSSTRADVTKAAAAVKGPVQVRTRHTSNHRGIPDEPATAAPAGEGPGGDSRVGPRKQRPAEIVRGGLRGTTSGMTGTVRSTVRGGEGHSVQSSVADRGRVRRDARKEG